MTSSASQTADYVRFLLERTGLSPSALAKRAGISPTTLTRKLNNGGHQFSLSLNSIERLEKATDWSYRKYLELTEELNVVDALIEANTSGTSAQQIGLVDKSIPIIGSVCAGLWYEQSILKKEVVSYLPFRSVESTNRIIAFRVRGNSCDGFADDGEIVICSPLRDDNFFNVPKIFIVETMKEGSDLVERTARVVAKTDETVGGRSFRYASSDPELAALPIERESDLVRAVAVVQWVARHAKIR